MCTTNAQLSLLAPFQKLEGGEYIHADGGDADRPLRVCGEAEDGKDEQQDARQYPGRVVNHSEESKAAADLCALRVESDQGGV